MKQHAWWVRRSWGIAVGTAVTAAVTIAHLAGALRTLELASLDVGFRYFGHIDADNRIVLIDVDDPTIKQVGRWPWPRRRFADMIRILHEAGAAVIAVDIVWSEPQARRIDHPLLSADADVDPPQITYGEVTIDEAIHDDDELADAIRQAGNVYLAMFDPLTAPGAESPDQSNALFVSLVRVLVNNYALNTEEIAGLLRSPAAEIEPLLPKAKRSAARLLARDYLAHHPDAAFAAFYRNVFAGRPLDRLSPDRQELLRGYRTEQAARHVLHDAPPVPPALQPHIRRAWTETFPLDKLARAAKGVGIVTFEPDPADGVLRDLPLVADVRGRIVPHLGFAVACDQLGIDLRSLRAIGPGLLSFVSADATRRWQAPLNAGGKTLINWHIDRNNPRWLNSFHHVSATRVMEVAMNRRAIQANLDYYGWMMTDAVELLYKDDSHGLAKYADLIRQRHDARRRRQPPDPAVHDAILAIEQNAVNWLEYMRREITGVEPQDADEAAYFERIRTLHDQLFTGKLHDEIDRIDRKLRRRNEELMAKLREPIDGKVCFVGYTATAIADTVNSPVFDDMPGVLAHANLLNTILQNRFPRVSSPTLGAVLIIATGLFVTLVTSRHGPRVSLISLLALLVVVLVPAAIVVNLSAYFTLGAAAAAGGVFIAWAFVTLYRQVIEQRQKRQIARSLARQTSPAIAARIARGASETDLDPQPADVTCYFSDLQGFTTLSERMGAEGTKEVLNRYLAAMSGVLLARRGSSKFMGDGIFAYFNAPIWPCEDHVGAACEGALECLAALETLKTTQADGPFAGELASLIMRAGIHTGPAFAGSYGSGERAEYTCIGDTVNVAARLESANKAFSTRTLVSQAVRDAVEERYAFRCLGALQVKGKTRALTVFELLGRVGEVPPDGLEYAEAFAKAVVLFGARNWDQAEQALDRCAERRADDPAITIYRNEIHRLRERPLSPDWNQAIVLTAK